MECNHKYNPMPIFSDHSGFMKKIYIYECMFCGHKKLVTYSSLLYAVSTIRKDTRNYVKSKSLYRKAS